MSHPNFLKVNLPISISCYDVESGSGYGFKTGIYISDWKLDV